MEDKDQVPARRIVLDEWLKMEGNVPCGNPWEIGAGEREERGMRNPGNRGGEEDNQTM